MQLLNTNISQNKQTTKYSNKKAQDLQNLVLFCYVAFSYYKDGGDAGICLTAIATVGQSRAAEGVHVAKQRHDEIVQSPHDRHKKQVERGFNLSFLWWKCGDLNPGPPDRTRHFLHV